MNSLSWLIYFVGLVDGVNTFALWLAIPGTVAVFAALVSWLILSGAEAGGDKIPESGWQWWGVGKNLAVSIWLVGWLLIIFVPSRQTLMLIAGSEVGEKLVKSEAVTSVVNPGMDLLKTWIKNETDRLKPKEK